MVLSRGAYAPLVQWRVLRGERLAAAAREGNKIKSCSKALQLDPTLHDALFGIGLYHYYADVAPAAAKILRWLLLLPGGDRVQGLQEMLQARDRGELLRGEADFQLGVVYPLVRAKTAEALELLAGSTRATRTIRSSSTNRRAFTTPTSATIRQRERRAARCARRPRVRRAAHRAGRV